MKKQAGPLSVLSLLLIAISIPFGVQMVEKGYQFPRAAEEESPVAFVPSTGTQPVGEPFTVNVHLNTRGEVIDALDLLIKGINLEVTGERVVLPEALSYRFGPENVLNRVLTSILADSRTGFRNTSGQSVLELSVKGLAHCAESRLVFDPDFSIVASQGVNATNDPDEAVFNIETPPGVTNPALTSPTEVEAIVNEPFSYRAAATNPNGTTLTYHYTNLPDWLTAEGPEIKGTPTQTGGYQAGIIVTDELGGSACLTLTITVTDRTEITIGEINVSPLSFDSATINWKTNRPATSVVEFGTTPSYGQTEERTELVESHHLTLHGLSPSVTYHFRVKSRAPHAPNEAVSRDHAFTTLPFPRGDRILKLNLVMEGKRPNDNDHPVTVGRRDGGWSRTFVPHGDGYYPLLLKDYPFNEPYNTADLILKGYQHLGVRRRIYYSADDYEQSINFGLLPTGDIAPKGSPDDFINTIDYSVMVSQMSLDERPGDSLADLNSDGAVNSLDYSLMLNNFGRDGET